MLEDANEVLLDAAASGDADKVAVALAAGTEVEARDANQRSGAEHPPASSA